MRFGPWEIGLILLIILIIFGVGKLPQVGSAIGKGMREFRKAQRGEEQEKPETKEKTEEEEKPETKGKTTEKTQG